MPTIAEEIEAWKKEYNESDIIGKYIKETCLLLENFRIKEILEWLKTQPEITKEEYLDQFARK